ncbi:hypothetical protein RZS08_18920, partial [Arthrospira platensis SPKY1]|nr:hypothetical protein [Arthrospira platensis SPKY1]
MFGGMVPWTFRETVVQYLDEAFGQLDDTPGGVGHGFAGGRMERPVARLRRFLAPRDSVQISLIDVRLDPQVGEHQLLDGVALAVQQRRAQHDSVVPIQPDSVAVPPGVPWFD